eukprot:4096346-Pleurochrysis_carterae.AAC.1
MTEHVGPLRSARCVHGERGHRQVAYGRDEQGAPRASAAAAYPAGMNAALARALLSAGEEAARARHAATGGDVSGGRVADGPGLSAPIRAAIEAARARPPPFASLRNLEPEHEATLEIEELPGDIRAPQPREPTGKRRRERKRKPLPRAAG